MQKKKLTESKETWEETKGELVAIHKAIVSLKNKKLIMSNEAQSLLSQLETTCMNLIREITSQQ
jgi:hypothetical protein